ncbi:MAG: metallophosphoesterase [Deltaproteobacteria bacterium]|nr:metallophosphoesterase [Deltaproteobacteria bacterium]
MQRVGSVFRRILLHDIWRNLALFLGLVQVQILHWLLVVIRADGLSGGAILLLTLGAMWVNAWLVPLIRQGTRAAGWRRLAARTYMNVGIGTMGVGLSVLAGWLVIYPAAHSLTFFGVDFARASEIFRYASGALTAGVTLMFAWGITLGQRLYARTHVPVRLPGLAPEHRGLRIVQISDLHIGNGLEDERLSALVDRVNELEPDVIAITGDLFDNDAAFVPDGTRRLSALRARLGVFAVLGNHDTYTGSELIAEALAKNAPGIRLLRGEYARLPLDPPIYLAGVDDPGRDWTARDLQVASLEKLAGKRPDDGPVVLLVHRPEVFHQASRLGFAVVLTGHTHGGQIALPLPGGHINPARIVTPFTRGIFRSGESIMYVNRGVGMAGPRIRFNCRREIATIELV